MIYSFQRCDTDCLAVLPPQSLVALEEHFEVAEEKKAAVRPDYEVLIEPVVPSDCQFQLLLLYWYGSLPFDYSVPLDVYAKAPPENREERRVSM